MSMNCQLTNIAEIVLPNSFLNTIWQKRIKFLWSAKSYSTFLKNVCINQLRKNKKRKLKLCEQHQISKGDMIRIKSKKLINDTLDNWGCYHNCMFLKEMYNYCGELKSTYKIVNNFYDEKKQRICKCKNIVVLNNIYCSGERKLFSVHCDRNCFLFWPTQWLEKI